MFIFCLSLQISLVWSPLKAFSKHVKIIGPITIEEFQLMTDKERRSLLNFKTVAAPEESVEIEQSKLLYPR